MCGGYGASAGIPFRLPLLGAGRALRQFPFVAEQVLKKTVAPLGRRVAPGDFQAACDCIGAFTCAEFAFPAKALLLNTGSFRLRPDIFSITGTVGFTEGMAACYECNRLFIVHRHACEG